MTVHGLQCIHLMLKQLHTTHSDHPLPSAVKLNCTDRALCYIEHLGNFFARHLPTQCPDFPDIIFCQPCRPVVFANPLQTIVIGMLKIPMPVTPFQIVDMIVGLVTVLVVDFRQTVRIGDECFSNQTVDVMVFLLTVFEKIDGRITILDVGL